MNKIYKPEADARWCQKNLTSCIVSPGVMEFDRYYCQFPLIDIVELQFGPRTILFEQPFRLPEPEDNMNESLFFQAQNFFWQRGSIQFSLTEFMNAPFYYYEHSPAVLTKEYCGQEFKLASIQHVGELPEWLH